MTTKAAMNTFTQYLALFLISIACSAFGQAVSSPSSLTNVNPSVAEIARSYTNFQQITKAVVYVNPELAMLCRGASKQEVDTARLRFGPHANTGVLIFMNDIAAAAFRTNANSYPVGAVVVKHKTPHGYILKDGKHVLGDVGVGGMVKRAPGFDAKHGDWEYFYFEDRNQIESGRISACVQCHDSAKQRDYIFGTWDSHKSQE